MRLRDKPAQGQVASRCLLFPLLCCLHTRSQMAQMGEQVPRVEAFESWRVSCINHLTGTGNNTVLLPACTGMCPSLPCLQSNQPLCYTTIAVAWQAFQNGICFVWLFTFCICRITTQKSLVGLPCLAAFLFMCNQRKGEAFLSRQVSCCSLASLDRKSANPLGE